MACPGSPDAVRALLERLDPAASRDPARAPGRHAFVGPLAPAAEDDLRAPHARVRADRPGKAARLTGPDARHLLQHRVEPPAPLAERDAGGRIVIAVSADRHAQHQTATG